MTQAEKSLRVGIWGDLLVMSMMSTGTRTTMESKDNVRYTTLLLHYSV